MSAGCNERVVLITGGYGFLGRAVARRFRQTNCRIVGLGRGRWAPEQARAHGFDTWLDAGVSLSSLLTLREQFDVIVHCAGNGSVGYSLVNPLQDFYKTVQSTADLLEFMRLTGARAQLIYPSSAAVYGAKADAPIRESEPPAPISPYGYHKHIVEQLLQSYSSCYGVRAAMIRFFSIYGPGLTKQLLWDAGTKLLEQRDEPAMFWGTGEETRDWISSDDAADLIWNVSCSAEQLLLINGASGVRTTVREAVAMLAEALGTQRSFAFNGAVREGDPRFFHAEVSRARALGWQPRATLQQGIRAYADWLRAEQERGS